MNGVAPFKTLLDLARQLGASSARTGSRVLLQAMQNDPGLRVTMRGRTIEALAWLSIGVQTGFVRTIGDAAAVWLVGTLVAW